MSGIYYCRNCGLVQVSQPDELCSTCAAQQTGDGWGGWGNDTGNQGDGTGGWGDDTGNQGDGTDGWGIDSDDPGDGTGGWGIDSNDPGDGTGGWGIDSDGPGKKKKLRWKPKRKKPPIKPPTEIQTDGPRGGEGRERAASPLQTGENEFRGVVRSLKVFQPGKENEPSFLGRWFDALFGPTPYSMKPLKMMIQLSVSASEALAMGNIGTTKHVEIYIDSGEETHIAPGDNIVVKGKQASNGVVHALSVYDETASTTLYGGSSPKEVRVITLLAVAAIYALVVGLTQGFGNLFSNVNLMQNLKDRLTEIIALLIVGGVLLSVIRSNPRLRKICFWIVLIVLVSLVFPPLGPIVILVFGLRMLMGF